jgi:hypothetical protein
MIHAEAVSQFVARGATKCGLAYRPVNAAGDEEVHNEDAALTVFTAVCMLTPRPVLYHGQVLQ